jgi:hypothetical protein
MSGGFAPKVGSAVLILASAGLLASCKGRGVQNGMQDYIATHQNGIRAIPWAQQMDNHFGRENVDHFITHYGFGEQPLDWNSEVHFGGRFVLTLQVPVNVDYSTNSVSIAGKPSFFLRAASKIEQLPDGRLPMHYETRLQREFQEETWKKLVASDFDLATLDVLPADERAIEGFDGHTLQVRDPRVKIPKSSGKTASQ